MSADPMGQSVIDAFWEYERALMVDDLPVMDRLFAPGPTTLRGDAAGLLVGHEEISRFRAVRGGAPARQIVSVRVHEIDDDHAVVIAVTAPASGGRGLQTQLWRRSGADWSVACAHVSGPPSTFDPSVWRVVGAPLVPATARGSLTGDSVAVKDLFAVEGHRIGAGVPDFLEQRRPEPVTATAVQRLLDRGAVVRGIARTDQFAYSLDGDNPHYGTPVNAVVSAALPGGSSNGSATAVALGAASIGLATDTAGSIRIPASYQGLWGLRTGHGAVPDDGVLPLAQDFDTIGLLSRSGAILLRAARALLDREADDAASPTERIHWAELSLQLPDLARWQEAFRVHQAYQAWQNHGRWIEENPNALAGSARVRFEAAARVDEQDDVRARRILDVARSRLNELLMSRILVLPAASSTAPRLWSTAPELDAVRSANVRTSCIAAITGRPALVVPDVMTSDGPVGRCLVGPVGTEITLIEAELAGEWSGECPDRRGHASSAVTE